MGNPFSYYTMANAIAALTGAIRERLDLADSKIGGQMVHPAHIEAAEARVALTALDEFVGASIGSDQMVVSEKTAGTVILDLMAR